MDQNVDRYPLPIIPLGWNPLSNFNQGTMRSMTWSYFSSDEVSSAAQKAVRRGFYEDAIQWFLELFWTNRLRQTNIWNRALVMSLEDIGPTAPLVALKIFYLYQHHPEDPWAIATAAYILALAPKCRANDWALLLYHSMDKEIINGSPMEIKSQLIASLNSKDMRLILYLICCLFYTQEKIIGKYKNAQWLVWEAFDEIIPSHPYVSTMKKWSMMSNWRWSIKSLLIYIHVSHLWCSDSLPMISELPTPLSIELRPIIERAIRREKLVGIPDYALDMHTRRGKKMGRYMAWFIEIGSHLENEDPTWKSASDQYLILVKDKLRI